MRIVGDAVQNIHGDGTVRLAQQTLEIDPSGDVAGRWRDAGDAVCLPDVGVDFPVDVFEFIQIRYRRCAVLHLQTSDLLKRCRIPEAQGGRAVAHNDARAIVRESPTLAGIAERPLEIEAGAVIDEAGLRLPGELQQLIVPVCNALAEILIG